MIKLSHKQVSQPTVFENYTVNILVQNNEVELTLWDTAGQEDYDQLRRLSYPDSDVVVIGYTVDWPDSLVYVQEKWQAEIMHFLPRVPIVLVGCKKDLRTDKTTIDKLATTPRRPVTYEEGLAVARKIGASAYLECNALTDEGVWDVLHVVSWLAVHKDRREARTLCSRWRKILSKNASAPFSLLHCM